MKSGRTSKDLFDSIYKEYSPLIREIIYSILEDKELAQDAFQLACISIAKNIEKIRKIYPEARNYVSKIAYNTAIDVYRKNQRIRDKELPLPIEEDMDEEEKRVKSEVLMELCEESFEEALFRKYDRIKLLESLEILDEKQSVYIYEYFYEEMTIKQIAERNNYG